jgi:hypothetical protein
MMAKEIKLSQIGDYMEGQIEQLLRVTVLEADGKLKEKSPVDLGRFRIGWQIGENASNSTPPPPGDYRGKEAPPKGYNYIAGQEKLGNYYSIHNNLPYAEKLADAAPGSGLKTETRYNPKREVKNWETPGSGSSHQTNGPGWIDLIGKEMQAFVRSAYEQIKRQG